MIIQAVTKFQFGELPIDKVNSILEKFKGGLGIADVELNEAEDDKQEKISLDSLFGKVNKVFKEEFDQWIQEQNEQYSQFEKDEEKQKYLKDFKEKQIALENEKKQKLSSLLSSQDALLHTLLDITSFYQDASLLHTVFKSEIEEAMAK